MRDTDSFFFLTPIVCTGDRTLKNGILDLFIRRMQDVEVRQQLIKAKVDLYDALKKALECE